MNKLYHRPCDLHDAYSTQQSFIATAFNWYFSKIFFDKYMPSTDDPEKSQKIQRNLVSNPDIYS